MRTGPRLSTSVLVFNATSPALSDVAVRKALWQGIDRAQLATVRFNGLDHVETPPGSALYHPFQPEYQDNMPVRFDAAAAAQTLEGAGYTDENGTRAKDGKPLSIRFTIHGDDPMSTALAQTVQNQLTKIGVEAQIDARPQSAFGQTMSSRDFDVLLAGGGSDSPDPTSAMCQTMCSTSPGNASGAGTPELDERIARLGAQADDDARAAEINAIEKEWLGQYGQLPLWHGPDVYAIRTGLSGLGPAAFASLTTDWEDVGWEPGTGH
nr:ABC transporter substrate-binding protein [Mobilicoccus caccae]